MPQPDNAPLLTGLLQPMWPQLPPHAVAANVALIWSYLSHCTRLPACRMGMNLRHPDTIPTYRENTVESFLRAAEAGATFVEFDVQAS